MGMGPKITRVQGTSQATPLAEDFLKILQGQLSEGAFGQGAGPLQRNAGTAIEQFVNMLQTRAATNTAGQLADRTGKLTSSLERGSNLRTNRAAADLREGFGAAGSRFGTPLAVGEANLRTDAGANLDQLIGSILMEQAGREQSAREFDVNAGLGQDQLLLSGIAQLFGQGQANLMPFLQMAQLGILPEEIIASPGIMQQLLTATINTGAALASGGAAQGVSNAQPTSINAGGFTPPQFFPGAGQPSGIGMSAGATGPSGLGLSAMPAKRGTFELDPRLFGGR